MTELLYTLLNITVHHYRKQYITTDTLYITKEHYKYMKKYVHSQLNCDDLNYCLAAVPLKIEVVKHKHT